MHHYAPLYTTIHHYAPLCPSYTTIHHYTPLYTTIHHHAPQYTTIHHYTPLYTTMHHYTPLYTTIHQYTHPKYIKGRIIASFRPKMTELQYASCIQRYRHILFMPSNKSSCSCSSGFHFDCTAAISHLLEQYRQLHDSYMTVVLLKYRLKSIMQ